MASVLLLLPSVITFIPFEGPIGVASAALTSIPPVVIEGNNGFSTHPRVTGGGTVTNPYLIANYIIDCSASTRAAIAIRNSTAFYVVKNVTIYSSASSPAILTMALYLSNSYQAMNGRFENVTILGGAKQVEMYNPIRMIFAECNFSNPAGTGTLVHASGGYYITFDKNRFDAPGQDLHFEQQSSWLEFTRNRGSIRDLRHDYFRYSDISNNTLVSRSMLLYSGFSSDVQGNVMSSMNAAYDMVSFIDCNKIKVANNSFEGGRYSLYLSHPNTYGPVYNAYYLGASFNIEFNRINGSVNGIYLHWATGYPYNNYMTVNQNRITNCSSYGFYKLWGGAVGTRVFRNLFEFNRGTGTTYMTGMSQAHDGWGQISWVDKGVGNFWRDKTVPDDDSDGIVDDKNYPINGYVSGSKDSAPVTNRWFDFERPTLTVVRPANRLVDVGYVNVSWTSHDNLSGMETVQLRLDQRIWANRSGNGFQCYKLTTGQHYVYLRAVDRANLRWTKELSLFVSSDRDPFVINSPEDGGFYKVSGIGADWTFFGDFVPTGLILTVDSLTPRQEDPAGPLDLDLAEGKHNIRFEFEDMFQNRFSEELEIWIDMTPPTLDLQYPSDGAVIANTVVNFRWATSDITGIKRREVQIDQEGSNLTSEDRYLAEVDEGHHTFSVSVTDMAGNTNEEAMEFWVKDNTSLHITSPLLSGPTTQRVHRVEWEYLSDFAIYSLTLTLDNEDSIPLPSGRTYYDIFLEEDGAHRITVRALDPVQNEILDRITIVLDRIPPDAGFIHPKDGDHLNSTTVNVEWNALESFGLKGYDLYVDGILVASGLKDRSKGLVLGPGVHTLGLLAKDEAGNIGRANITVVVDVKAPEIILTSPDGNVITDNYVTFRWTASDDWGIASFNWSLDDGNYTDIGDSTYRELRIDEEGPHRFNLICSDIAGNRRLLVKDYIVDLTGPSVALISPPTGYIKEWIGVIRWTASDIVGVKSLVLRVDGTDIPLAVNTSYHFIDFEEGPHSYNVSVTDMAMRKVERSTSFILDRTPPRVSKALENAKVEGNRIMINWIIEEGIEGLGSNLKVDGANYTRQADLVSGEMDIGPLDPGDHMIELVIFDLAGNEFVLTWTATTAGSEEGTDDGPVGGGMVPLILMGIILTVAIVAVALYIILRKRGGPAKEGKTVSAPKRPDKIKVGMPVAAPVQSNAPQVPSRKERGHVLDEGMGPSYYRPEKKSRRMPRDIDRSSTVMAGAIGVEKGPTVTGPLEGPTTIVEAPPEAVTDRIVEAEEIPPPPSSEVDEIEEWGDDGAEELEEVEELEELEEVEDWEG